jgi:hypothetical protein
VETETTHTKEELERVKHHERIAAANKKKRKFSSGRRTGSLLKNVSSIFEQESDCDESHSGNGSGSGGVSGGVSECVSVDSKVEPAVDDAQFEIILKTSAFLFDNQNKVAGVCHVSCVSCVMCHVCHVSCVMCHVSCVMCHVLIVTFR